MANRYAAYSQPVPGGYRVMIRLSRDAHPKPVARKDGSPEVYGTKQEASDVIIAHLLAYMNGREIRGEVFETGDYTRTKAAKAQANRIFKRSEGAAA